MSFTSFDKHPVHKFRRYIIVRDQFEGFHSYPDAPEKVAFLKNSHRHLFKLTIQIEVFHEDRELEFFLVQDLLRKEIIPFLRHQDLGSCETVAETICDGLVNCYGEDRYIDVEVSEDGENSGKAIYEPFEQDPREFGRVL